MDKLSKGKSNFENVLASHSCVFGKAGLGFNPQNKQDMFSKSFLRKSEKQPIVKTKQPVVTCFYCMKKGHSVRFCKIRKNYLTKGFMRWIPKGCDVSNSKEKPNGRSEELDLNAADVLTSGFGAALEQFACAYPDLGVSQFSICHEVIDGKIVPSD